MPTSRTRCPYNNYHGSPYGYYLEALIVFGSVTSLDPRSLSANDQLIASDGKALQPFHPVATKAKAQ